MRLLLDTHVLVSVLDGRPDALGRRIQTIFEDQQNTFAASVASLWEIAIKWRLGKLRLARSPERLPDLLADFRISLLAITPEQVLADVAPEPTTRDPFDRLLLGVCRADAFRLVTVDRALITHPLALRA